jgi:hypothetical protein
VATSRTKPLLKTVQHPKLKQRNFKMSSIRQKIEVRLDELEVMLKNGNYTEAEELLPSITKFTSVLTEEQRDFIGAARLAIEENLDWFN